MIISAGTICILQIPAKAGISNLYSFDILIKLLNRRHQILHLPATIFSLKKHDQLEVALGLFNVGPFAIPLSFYAALSMFSISDVDILSITVTNLSTCVSTGNWPACEFRKCMVPLSPGKYNSGSGSG